MQNASAALLADRPDKLDRKTKLGFGVADLGGNLFFTIGGFSAHADQKDLLEWVGHFVESHPRAFVVHGEATASETLAGKIKEKFHLEAHVPQWKENLILKPKKMPLEVEEEREAPIDYSQRMLNNIIDLEKELNKLKKRIQVKEAKEKINEDDVDKLKYVQEELQDILSG